MVADIAAFLKPSCKHCLGQGYEVRVFHAGAKGEVRVPQPCRCALKGFKKARGQDVEQVGNEIRWKAGKEPQQAVA
jgi:hypothetical protein